MSVAGIIIAVVWATLIVVNRVLSAISFVLGQWVKHLEREYEAMLHEDHLWGRLRERYHP